MPALVDLYRRASLSERKQIRALYFYVVALAAAVILVMLLVNSVFHLNSGWNLLMFPPFILLVYFAIRLMGALVRLARSGS